MNAVNNTLWASFPLTPLIRNDMTIHRSPEITHVGKLVFSILAYSGNIDYSIITHLSYKEIGDFYFALWQKKTWRNVFADIRVFM